MWVCVCVSIVKVAGYVYSTPVAPVTSWFSHRLRKEQWFATKHLLGRILSRACLSAEPHSLRWHRSVEHRRKSLSSGRGSLGSGRHSSLQHAITEPTPTMQVLDAEGNLR